jgi:hypothetical protein
MATVSCSFCAGGNHATFTVTDAQGKPVDHFTVEVPQLTAEQSYSRDAVISLAAKAVSDAGAVTNQQIKQAVEAVAYPDAAADVGEV